MYLEGVFNNSEMQIDCFEFEVSGISSVHFELLEGEFEHFFVVVKDPNKQIRALLTFKTRQKIYCLATNELASDNNTVPGELPDGIWTVEVLRTYQVGGGYKIGIHFNLGTNEASQTQLLEEPTDRVYDGRQGWYKGDFHLHSRYSDGRVSLEEVVEACENKDLDFMCMTDHSTVTTKFPKTKLLVIPGTEVTWDDFGHYNIHGLREIIDYPSFVRGSSNKDEALDRLFKHYSSLGHVLSINHPFPDGWTLKHNYDIRSFKLMEVVNAPHLFHEHIDNERAIKFCDFLWNHGHYLYIVGGSDSHKKNYFDKYPAGVPTTKVFCNGLSQNNVLGAIGCGNAFLQIEKDIEVAFNRPGQEKNLVLPGSKTTGEVSIKGRCLDRLTWQLVKNGEVIEEVDSKRCAFVVDVRANEFYRLQARDSEQDLVMITNPVHNMQIEPEVFMFQELLNAFYDSERQ